MTFCKKVRNRGHFVFCCRPSCPTTYGAAHHMLKECSITDILGRKFPPKQHHIQTDFLCTVPDTYVASTITMLQKVSMTFV